MRLETIIPTITVPVYRVMAWNTTTRSWTERSRHGDESDAGEHAEALQWKGVKRVRVIPGKTTRVVPAAPIVNPTREFRFTQAGLMSDRADACKPYKSAGSDQLALPK